MNFFYLDSKSKIISFFWGGRGDGGGWHSDFSSMNPNLKYKKLGGGDGGGGG